jgi:L-ascorbate metabolism protein UlaG (beta-lactamase superfamily)
MKRISILLLIGLLVLHTALPAQDKNGKVEITWRGQSFFEIKTTKGTHIAIDPHQIPEYGIQLLDEKGKPIERKPHLILMSHNHNDHTQLWVFDHLKDKKEKLIIDVKALFNDGKLTVKDKDVTIIAGIKGFGQRATWNIVDEKIKDVRVRTVATYHDDMEGLKHGKNSVLVIEVDGWRIVHLGDLGHELTSEQLKAITKDGPIDVLMIPVGGVYTLNGSEAKRVLKQLNPKEYVIPMHYGTPIYEDLLSNAEFLDEQPKDKIAILKHNAVELDRDPKRPRPQITVLHYWPQKRKTK